MLQTTILPTLNPFLLGPDTTETLAYLNRNVIGQGKAIDTVVRLLQNIKAGLREPNRPAGSLFLMGPTGVGKTALCEAVATSLHGSPKNLLVINCGEYQMEHEVAKLIGAPPGYLGHRETQPILSQQRLSQGASPHCPTPLVLFDEIEKASNSMMRLLLGILDKATLRLGDNSSVNFEEAVIFFTSNLGAKELSRQHTSQYFAPQPAVTNGSAAISGERAAKKSFSPEFWNRLDRIITFDHLHADQLSHILDLELLKLEARGRGRFLLEVGKEAKAQILKEGTSMVYGARELKRTLDRHLVEPLSNLLVSAQIPKGHSVHVNWVDGEMKFGLGGASVFSVGVSGEEGVKPHTSPKSTRPRKPPVNWTDAPVKETV